MLRLGQFKSNVKSSGLLYRLKTKTVSPKRKYLDDMPMKIGSQIQILNSETNEAVNYTTRKTSIASSAVISHRIYGNTEDSISVIDADRQSRSPRHLRGRILFEDNVRNEFDWQSNDNAKYLPGLKGPPCSAFSVDSNTDKSTHAVASSLSMQNVDDLYTFLNATHIELKIALETLAAKLGSFRTARLKWYENNDLKKQDQVNRDDSRYVINNISCSNDRLILKGETVIREIKNNKGINPKLHNDKTPGNHEEQNRSRCDINSTFLKHPVGNEGKEKIFTVDSACDCFVDSLLFPSSQNQKDMLHKYTDKEMQWKKEETTVLSNKKKRYLASDIVLNNTCDNGLRHYEYKRSCVDIIVPSNSQNIPKEEKKSSLHDDDRVGKNGKFLQDVRMETLDLKITQDLDSTHVKRVYSDSDNEDDSHNDSACSSGHSTMSSEPRSAYVNKLSGQIDSMQFHPNLKVKERVLNRTDAADDVFFDSEQSKSSTHTSTHQMSNGITSNSGESYLELDFDELFSEDEDFGYEIEEN